MFTGGGCCKGSTIDIRPRANVGTEMPAGSSGGTIVAATTGGRTGVITDITVGITVRRTRITRHVRAIVPNFDAHLCVPAI
ncbi:hypothetical protein [Sphingomonas hankookensis]